MGLVLSFGRNFLLLISRVVRSIYTLSRMQGTANSRGTSPETFLKLYCTFKIEKVIYAHSTLYEPTINDDSAWMQDMYDSMDALNICSDLPEQISFSFLSTPFAYNMCAQYGSQTLPLFSSEMLFELFFLRSGFSLKIRDWPWPSSTRNAKNVSRRRPNIKNQIIDSWSWSWFDYMVRVRWTF